MWQPYYVEWDFLVAINITCTVGIFWGLTNTDLSVFSIFFLNPFACVTPITACADPHPQLVSRVLSFASKRERTLGATLPRPFYRLWRHQFLMVQDTIREWAWFGQEDRRESSLTSRLRDSWVRWIEKAWTPFFFPFSRPTNFSRSFHFRVFPTIWESGKG